MEAHGSKLLAEASKILFLGFASTGGGHTDRMFNVVRSLLSKAKSAASDDPLKHAQEAAGLINDKTVVILMVPPMWPPEPTKYLASTTKFLGELLDAKCKVLVFRAPKTATGLYDAEGGRGAILKHFARFPFANPKAVTIHFDTYQQHLDKSSFSKLAEFLEESAALISAKDLVKQVVADAGDAGKIHAITDMDYALTRALAKAGVPAKNMMDQENHLGLFINDPTAATNLVEYCLMGKVLPADGQNSKVSHIGFADKKKIKDILDVPNPVVHLKALVDDLRANGQDVQNMFKMLGLDNPYVGQKFDEWHCTASRRFVLNFFKNYGRQLAVEHLPESDSSASGIVWGSGPLTSMNPDKVTGIVYLYVSQYTPKVLKYIHQALTDTSTTGTKKALTEAYKSTLFVLCAPDTIDPMRIKIHLKMPHPEDAKVPVPIRQATNALALCYLAGADGISQGGAGTLSEYAYLAAGSGGFSRLLCWPMGGQDEQQSNAQFMKKLYAGFFDVVEEKSFGAALDELVALRVRLPDNGYWGSYLTNVINSQLTVADQAADILLADAPAIDSDVELALKNKSAQSSGLRATYRLLKICVQMFDQLEGPVQLKVDNPVKQKGLNFLAQGYRYQDFLHEGRYVIAVTSQKTLQITDAAAAIKLFSNHDDVEHFIGCDKGELDGKAFHSLTGPLLAALKSPDDKAMTRKQFELIVTQVKSGF